MVLGRHYILDIYDCDKERLKSVEEVGGMMREAGEVGKLHVVEESFHQFLPYGVSGVLVLAESHFSIHTWPEYGYASVDLYLCDESTNVDSIFAYLLDVLNTNNYKIQKLERGIID